MDIFINFRTVYKDKTDTDVEDGKKIALRYVLYGRFPIDVIASVPLDFVILFIKTSKQNLRFLGMIKMVRLLRLGRMISFLKKNQKLKLSMKVFQLVFLLTLCAHWINCFWQFVVSMDREWFPPKDIDFKTTIAYEGPGLDKYIMYFYYGVLFMVGNEVIPRGNSELIVATLLVFVGAIVIGLTIGEFSSIVSAYSANERAKTDELDIISSVMMNLRLKVDVQSRVLEYYDELMKVDFVTEPYYYSLLSPHLSNTVKLFQIKKTIRSLSFMDIKNIREVESFASK